MDSIPKMQEQFLGYERGWTVSQKCRSNFLGYVHGFGRIANGRHRREQGVEMDGILETQERFLGYA